MINLAGNRETSDDFCSKELAEAGIEIFKMPESTRCNHPEMRTVVRGTVGPWAFERLWRYWAASGPGLPLEHAVPLHAGLGEVVRVAGYAGGVDPVEWHKGFAVPFYHIDTQAGLNEFARILKAIMSHHS